MSIAAAAAAAAAAATAARAAQLAWIERRRLDFGRSRFVRVHCGDGRLTRHLLGNLTLQLLALKLLEFRALLLLNCALSGGGELVAAALLRLIGVFVSAEAARFTTRFLRSRATAATAAYRRPYIEPRAGGVELAYASGARVVFGGRRVVVGGGGGGGAAEAGRVDEGRRCED